MPRTFGLAVLLCAATAAPTTAQRQSQPWMPVAPPAVPSAAVAAPSARSQWLPPLASALIPGSGQLLQGRARGAAYLAIEAVLLVRFLTFYREGVRESDAYRDLAFTVARAPFEPAIRDTVFEYYEQMGKYIESGPFDQDPGAEFKPADDPHTYNGTIWQLASDTYFPDPDNPPEEGSQAYQRALAFYQSRAIGPNFLWSWRNAGLEQDLFRRSIHQSDEGFRRATQHLGLMLANHLISAVDAFITGRLAAAGADVEVRSSVSSESGGDGAEWTTGVRIGF